MIVDSKIYTKNALIKLRSVFVVVFLLLGLSACQQDVLSDDPSLRISFSHDTLMFDTVFTDMGSSTKRMLVYNPNKNAVQIKQVSMQDGRYFHINLDGENQLDHLRDITLRGGDSLFLFVRGLYNDSFDVGDVQYIG